MKPRLLDLFCCAGGAAMGYHRAGFEVVGVDIKPQPHYPFEFHQADALTYPLEGFDAYHASPPCQRFSVSVHKAQRKKHPDFIESTRQRLKGTNKPYVIENVVRAPLHEPFMLCGSTFGYPIRRHRIFESNVFVMTMPCSHKEYPRIYPPAINRVNPIRVLSISGGYTRKGGITLDQHKEAMGIDWEVTEKELSEAIPPFYTEYIGKYLMDEVLRNRLNQV